MSRPSSHDHSTTVRQSLHSRSQSPHSQPVAGNASDESSRTRRLLRGSQNASALQHKLTMIDIEAQHRLAWHRSHFDPHQPRVPAGHPDGGQWTSEGEAEGTSEPQVISDATPDNAWKPGAQYASRTTRVRIGGRLIEVEQGQAIRLFEAMTRAQDAIARVRERDPSWRPQPSAEWTVEGQIRAYEAEAEQAQAQLRELARFESSPIIPKKRPNTIKEQNDVAREIARWLVRHRGSIVEGIAWLHEYEESIEAYLDPPKTLQELQQAVSTPKRGYEIHHLVEKKSAEDDGFPKLMINGPDNLVRISRFKHWEITSWQMTKNKSYNDISPRDYLRGKDWEERKRLGLETLRKYGVLQP